MSTVSALTTWALSNSSELEQAMNSIPSYADEDEDSIDLPSDHSSLAPPSPSPQAPPPCPTLPSLSFSSSSSSSSICDAGSHPLPKQTRTPPNPQANSKITVMFSKAYTANLSYLCKPLKSTTSSSSSSSSRLQIHGRREYLLSSLLTSYIFPSLGASVNVVPPMLASRVHLAKFHDEDYLNMIQFGSPHDQTSTNSGDCGDDDEVKVKSFDVLADEYGLTDDCMIPPFNDIDNDRPRLWKYVCSIAGASLHAASLLKPYTNVNADGSKTHYTSPSPVCINWGGGRHHAHRSKAGGFCYINDAVLSIQYLRKKFGKVLYLDVDIHHADGVQEAFYDTDNVFVCSFHKCCPGFFPGTGSGSEVGRGIGKYYTLNVPLPTGMTDSEFVSFYKKALDKVIGAYQPNVIVLAVGADGLANDPIVGPDGWKLTTRGLCDVVKHTVIGAQKCHAPLLLLGGGGYDDVRATKVFATCTVAAFSGIKPNILIKLKDNIPPHDFFPFYGPDFKIHTSDVMSCRDEFGSAGGAGGEGGMRKARDAVDDVCCGMRILRRRREVKDGGFTFYDDEDDENEEE